MINLLEASKKDKQWRIFARKICNDDSLADDIVQEMYLKLYNIKKLVNDFYILMMLKTIFLDLNKKNKRIIFIDSDLLQNICKEVEFQIGVDDNEKKIIDKFNSLPFHQKELILESSNKSLRDIQKEFNIHYGFVHRELKKARKIIFSNG